MEKFIDFVLQFGNLNKQQIELIISKATDLELQKDELYWEAGKKVKQIGFLTAGVIRVYYYNNKGEEITRYFIDENHLILSGNTIDEVYTPSEYLSAITDCRLVAFSKPDWKELSDTIIGWDNFAKNNCQTSQRKNFKKKRISFARWNRTLSLLYTKIPDIG